MLHNNREHDAKRQPLTSDPMIDCPNASFPGVEIDLALALNVSKGTALGACRRIDDGSNATCVNPAATPQAR